MPCRPGSWQKLPSVSQATTRAGPHRQTSARHSGMIVRRVGLARRSGQPCANSTQARRRTGPPDAPFHFKPQQAETRRATEKAMAETVREAVGVFDSPDRLQDAVADLEASRFD